MQFPRARAGLGVALGLFILFSAGDSSGQTWSPDSISLSVPGGGAQCSYVEVVMTSGLTMGHESTSVHASGAGFVEGWDEKCGWGQGPCPAGPGTGEWNPAIGYGGPLHLIYQLTSSPAAKFWVVWDDGHVGPPIYTTHEYPVSVTPAAAKNLGLWATRSQLPADGKSVAALSIAASGPTCGALKSTPVVLTTSHGRLRAGTQEGASISVTTGADGRAAATLVAADTAGTAQVRADIGGATAETTVRMLAKTLTLTASPTEIASDGSSASTLTVTAKDANGVPQAGQSVVLNASGGLLDDGDRRMSIVQVVTGSSGSAFALLTAAGSSRTIHVDATWGNVTASTDVEAVGYTIDLTTTVSRFTKVPATEFGQVVTTSRSAVDAPVATLYGRTEIPIWIKVAQRPDRGGVVSGKTVRLRCDEADAFGTDRISYLKTVVTDSAGEGVSTLVVDDLWRANPRPGIILTFVAEVDGLPGVTSRVYIPIIDNRDQILSFYRRQVPEGAIWQHDAWAGSVNETPIIRALWQRVLQDHSLAGLVNNAYAGVAFAYMGRTWQEQFKQFRASAYQRRVLDLLQAVHHNATPRGQTDWWMNGLDYGPSFAIDDQIKSVVLYPRETDGRREWTQGEVRILDPWFEQRPQVYTQGEYLARLLPLSVVADDGKSLFEQLFDDALEALFGTPDPLRQFYPKYGHDYPLVTPVDVARPEPAASVDVHCPVFVTVDDASGKRSGYRGADRPTASFFVRENADVAWVSVVNAAGTLDWHVDLPERPMTVRATAYADGPMTLEVFHRPTGLMWRYVNVPMLTGERASVLVDPSAAAAPALTFGDGRTVAAVVEPMTGPGVTPATGLVPGGAEIVVSGIPVTRASQVWLGDALCADAEWLNGMAIRCTTPRHAAGTTDIRVSTNGVEAGVLSAAYTVDYLRTYFAEGATSQLFSTRFALLNPGPIEATADLQYLKSDGSIVTETRAVAPHARATVDPASTLGPDTAEFSTVVRSTDPVVVDRTMTWSRGEMYGSHAERAVSSPSLTWYLAEGATHSGFDLFYLLQNPGATPAQVRVTYLRPSPALPIEQLVEVAEHSRFNLWVNLVELPAGSGEHPLASTDVSAKIEVLSGPPIIVERAMYLNAQGKPFNAGHESAGVTAPDTHWFLAEGATGPFFDLFILVANPTDREAAIEARYMLADGTVLTKAYSVAANSRFNIWANLEEIPEGSGQRPLTTATVSTLVSSTNGVPVIVERSMWWPKVTGWYEAHNSPGSTVAGTRWALADGEVGGTGALETYVLIANTSAFAGAARVTAVLEDGTTHDLVVDLLPNSRMTVPMGAPAPFGFGTAVAGRRFGTIVESVDTGAGVPQIVIERAMYNNAAGVMWAAGSNALGTRLR